MGAVESMGNGEWGNGDRVAISIGIHIISSALHGTEWRHYYHIHETNERWREC